MKLCDKCGTYHSHVCLGVHVQPDADQVLMPVRLDDDLLRYAMECTKLNNPEGARLIRSAYYFLVEAVRSRQGKV